MPNKKAGKSLHGGHVPYGDRYGYSSSGGTISHYYGDWVRAFFLGAAAVMLLGAPFYADNVRAELPFVVVAALVVVCLAALTNPWKKSILIADAIVAGVGMLVYQIWALNGYGVTGHTSFILREAISIIFLFAFYFSVKTVRAMILNQIGKRASLDEFGGGTPAPSEDAEKSSLYRIKHSFDEEPIGDDDVPSHKPTFNEKAGD
jgi:hypothetical protein